MCYREKTRIHKGATHTKKNLGTPFHILSAVKEITREKSVSDQMRYISLVNVSVCPRYIYCHCVRLSRYIRCQCVSLPYTQICFILQGLLTKDTWHPLRLLSRNSINLRNELRRHTLASSIRSRSSRDDSPTCDQTYRFFMHFLSAYCSDFSTHMLLNSILQEETLHQDRILFIQGQA